jgi:hypothetical protein
MGDALVERQLGRRTTQRLRIQEREVKLIARGVEDDVGISACAVGEVDSGAFE